MFPSIRTLATVGVSAVLGGLFFVRSAMSASPASTDEFRPIKEAEMPRGFPSYTPVGTIEFKQYPAYRKATASGMMEFWTLFGHIRENNVAMTAPVEMNYGDPKPEKPSEKSMSFLYGTPEQGKVGRQNGVEVSDVLAMKVVSIGCRGSQTDRAVADAERKLLACLDERKDQYVVAGPLRVMGYNSPFVPRDKNYFEVQIPVKPVETVAAR